MSTQDPFKLISHGNIKALTERLNNGLNINTRGDYGQSLLLYSNVFVKNDIIELLIMRGADVNTPNMDGVAPLHEAIVEKNQFAINLLIRTANINAQTDVGWTPLHFAVRLNNTEAVKLLLEKGADITILSNNQETALDLAKSGRWDNDPLIIQMIEDKSKKDASLSSSPSSSSSFRKKL